MGQNKKIWKKCILIVTCLGLIVGGTFSSFLIEMKQEIEKPFSWRFYSSKDQRFDAQFPAPPEEKQKEMVIANKKIIYNELTLEALDAVYAVSYLDFPKRWKMLGTKKLLSKSFDMILENEQHVQKLLKKELSAHLGHPALDYHFKQGEKEVKGKFIISGNTLYRIAVTYPIAFGEKEASTKTFLDSFQIRS